MCFRRDIDIRRKSKFGQEMMPEQKFQKLFIFEAIHIPIKNSAFYVDLKVAI